MTEISDEERTILQSGKMAKELLALPAWKAYVAGLTELSDAHKTRALQPGSTEYEKGTVFGIFLASRLPLDSIDMREELLRELALRGIDEDGKELPSQKKEVSP